MITRDMKTKTKLFGLKDMLFSSIIFAAAPLVIVLAGGKNNPLLLMSLWAIGNAIAFFIYVYLKHRYLLSIDSLKQICNIFLNKKDKNSNKKHPSIFNVFDYRSILIPFQVFATLLLGWSFQYIHSILASAVYQSWPILYVLLLVKITPDQYSSNKRTFFLFAAGFSSVLLVVLSGPSDFSFSSLGWSYLFGLLLILIAIVFTVQDVPKLKQCKKFAEKQHREELFMDKSEEYIQNGTYILLSSLALFCSSIIGFFAFAVFEIFNVFQGFSGNISVVGMLIIVCGGPLIVLFGSIFNIKGTIAGKDVRVQCVKYIIPIISTGYLIALTPLKNILPMLIDDIPNINWVLFVVGFIGIISVNMVINFKTEDSKFGLTSLVITLWITGAIVLFRDDVPWWKNSIEDNFLNNTQYYVMLLGIGIIFILLVVSENGRMENRISKEDDILLKLIHKLEYLYPNPNDRKLKKPYLNMEIEYAQDGEKENKWIKASTIMECLEQMGIATAYASIKRWYEPIMHHLEMDDNEDGSIKNRKEYIMEVIIDMDKFGSSKHQSMSVHRWMPITLVAFFIIAVSLTLRPSGVGGISAIVVDAFAFFFASLIVYMNLNMFDIIYNRKISAIENITNLSGNKHWRIQLPKPEINPDVWLASILIIFNSLAYIVLFVVKWA